MDYVRFAISEECQPDMFDGNIDEARLDRSVLDDRCISVPVFLSNIAAFLADDFEGDQNTRQLLSVLCESLLIQPRRAEVRFIAFGWS